MQMYDVIKKKKGFTSLRLGENKWSDILHTALLFVILSANSTSYQLCRVLPLFSLMS